MMRYRSNALIAAAAGALLVLPAVAVGKPTRHGVSFSPATVHAGDRVRVSAPARRGQALLIYLAKHATARRSDLKLGRMRAARGGRAVGSLQVPGRTVPGYYFVLACRAPHRGCTGSRSRLLVLTARSPVFGGGGGGSGGGGGGSGSGGTGTGGGAGSGTGPGDYKYIVKYTHADSASSTRSENSSLFIGTETFNQSFGLSSEIETDGDPYTGSTTGSGAIDYTEAAYHDERQGSFQSQGGVAGSPGACNGTDTTDLTGTSPGTATVVGLQITQTQITLQFRPGQFAYGSTPAGPPGETLHNVQTYDACPGADSTEASTRFLNTFENFYDTLEDSNPNVRLVGMGTSSEYVQLSGGWQSGGPDQPNVVATLTISGQWYSADPNSTYTDQFEIDRVPDQG